MARNPIYHLNFSSDGRTILFTRERHGALNLYAVPAHGRKKSLVLAHAASGSYSPIDRAIAFWRTGYHWADVTEITQGNAWVANADGRNPRALGPLLGSMSQVDPTRLWPMWSPTGRRIVFEPTFVNGLVVVDARTGRATDLGTGKHPSWLDHSHRGELQQAFLVRILQPIHCMIRVNALHGTRGRVRVRMRHELSVRSRLLALRAVRGRSVAGSCGGEVVELVQQQYSAP
jgi:hypothetical protein